jgi:hypothetical protein
MTKKSASTVPSIWTKYRVTWQFSTAVCGSTPADSAIIQKWLEARQPRVKPAGALSIQEINEEVLASIERGEGEADTTFSLLVFQRHAGACVERYNTVRAHLKDCARVLSAQFIGRIQGERAFSTRVINGVYLDPAEYWIPIRRPDGAVVTTQDGNRDKPIHVRGPRGEPLNALKNFEYIDPPCLMTFTLLVLGRSVSDTDLHHLFSYGGIHGFGGERSDGEGRYSYGIERLDESEAKREAIDVAR